MPGRWSWAGFFIILDETASDQNIDGDELPFLFPRLIKCYIVLATRRCVSRLINWLINETMFPET